MVELNIAPQWYEALKDTVSVDSLQNIGENRYQISDDAFDKMMDDLDVAMLDSLGKDYVTTKKTSVISQLFDYISSQVM
ncbi:hypothetical protein LJC07_04535 [Christensenellaceae bacterium OttesenSCG-928-L17]|nr:hypothetical protein [Christensenellaceae bacterium OttesenSCG-928-L17]